MLTNNSGSKLPTSVIGLNSTKHHHQINSSASQVQQSNQTNNQTHHPIPPRYQPPPQPPGGILKNIGLKNPISYYTTDLNQQNTNGHLNIKYPPEVPKLTNIYLPEGIKNSSGIPNSSRLLQPRATGLRLSNGINNNNTNSNNNTNIESSGIGIHGSNTQSQRQRIQSVEEELLSRQVQSSQQQQQNQEMLKFVRKSDGEQQPSPNSTNSGPNINHNTQRLSAEHNRHFQSLIAELRSLKEANQRLSDDNQELRDLCCFLDDDRQKGRKLAREWQRFGRYTASVMRQEVSAYQSKLRQLDDKQQELIRDNLELKELCLYLDEERVNVQAAAICANCGTSTSSHIRDDGDGSSSSTNPDEAMPNVRQFDRNEITMRASLSDQTLQYVRSLEHRIRQLEDENLSNVKTEIISSRPEAVVRALQVLEVREQLERDRIGGNATISSEHTMDDREKALVREMCNVVWRKLEDGSNVPSEMDHL